MKFFIDTANVDEIRKANDMGIICGVTTNPSLIAKEGRDFKEVIKEITSIVDGAISGEVKATTVAAEDMIKEAREIAAIHPNMVVKIPMTMEGLKAVNVFAFFDSTHKSWLPGKRTKRTLSEPKLLLRFSFNTCNISFAFSKDLASPLSTKSPNTQQTICERMRTVWKRKNKRNKYCSICGNGSLLRCCWRYSF